MAKILGGSKSRAQSTSESSNLAYQPIQQAFSPLLTQAQTGANSFAKLLSGDATDYNKYKDVTGYDFLLNRGIGGVGASMAGGRMFNSGAAAKAIQEYGSGFEEQYAQSYLDRLLAQMGIGTGAASAMSSAGNVSKSQSTQKSYSGDGILGGLMKIAGGFQ